MPRSDRITPQIPNDALEPYIPLFVRPRAKVCPGETYPSYPSRRASLDL